MNEEASGTGQAISTQPTFQQSKVQVLTRGENSGALGGNGAGQAISAIILVQGTAFDQLTTWIPFFLKIVLREQFKISARKISLPSRGNSKGATREIDMGLDRQLV